MKSQKASIIILSFFAALYLILGAVLIFGSEYVIPGIIYVVAGLVSVLSITAIKKQNKVLLWIGIILGAIQILDGLSAIVNMFAYGDTNIISTMLHVIISILFFFPVRLMYKMTKYKKLPKSL